MGPYEKIRRLIDIGKVNFSEIPKLLTDAGHNPYRRPVKNTFKNMYINGPGFSPHQFSIECLNIAHTAKFKGRYELIAKDRHIINLRDAYYTADRNQDEKTIDTVEESCRRDAEKCESMLERIDCGRDRIIIDLIILYFLLFRINHDRMRRGLDSKSKNVQLMAQNYLSKARKYHSRCNELLSKTDSLDLNVIYQLRASKVALELNSTPSAEREKNHAKVRDIFDGTNYESLSLELVEAEPFQWSAHRNLMTYYMYMGDEDGYLRAFLQLIEACPRFAELSYKAGEKSIKEDIDTNKMIEILYDKGYKD